MTNETNNEQNQTNEPTQENIVSETPQESRQADQVQEQIAKLEQENSDLNNKLLRTLAELENVRRRSREELEKSAKFAISNFATELVVITENFFLASENAPKDEIEANPKIKNYADAITMTEKELLKVLEKNHIKRIYPLNEKFDHNIHEAVSQIESESESGTVVKVVQAGYTIANRIIRPSLVVVAK